MLPIVYKAKLKAITCINMLRFPGFAFLSFHFFKN